MPENQVIERLVFNVGGPQVRREEMDGRTWVVCPFVSIPGDTVLNGSNGPGFYPDEENAKACPLWNTRLIVVNHPFDKKRGKFISAANKDVITNDAVGIILNSYNDKKLGGEAWFDELKTKKVDARIINRLDKGEKIELSTGLEATHELTKGTAPNGTKYDFIVRNHKPDHLAVLLDTVGASSIKDGAGFLVNEKSLPEGVWTVLRRSILNGLQNNFPVSMENNELSFSDTSYELCEMLSAKFGEPGKYWDGWICDVYSEFVVFYNQNQLYVIGYTVSKDDEISFNGDPIEVERVISYRTKDGKVFARNEATRNLSLKEDAMAEKKTDPEFDRKSFTDKLIKNGAFNEEDRKALDALPEKMLKAMDKTEVPAPTPIPTPVPAPVANAEKSPVFDEKVWLANAPKEWQDVVKFGAQELQVQKQALIEKITANKGNLYSVQDLSAKEIEELRKIVALLPEGTSVHQVPGMFLGNASPMMIGNANVGGPAPIPLIAPDPWAPQTK